jgi:hypothetical protein
LIAGQLWKSVNFAPHREQVWVMALFSEGGSFCECLFHSRLKITDALLILELSKIGPCSPVDLFVRLMSRESTTEFEPVMKLMKDGLRWRTFVNQDSWVTGTLPQSADTVTGNPWAVGQAVSLDSKELGYLYWGAGDSILGFKPGDSLLHIERKRLFESGLPQELLHFCVFNESLPQSFLGFQSFGRIGYRFRTF